MWISRVRITGGFLGGLDVRLGRGLNVIIGGRGAGKTTFLELIRHALGVPHADELRSLDRSEFISTMLGDGEIVIDVEMPNATERIVVDSAGGGRQARLSLGALMLGQNELETIASNSESRLNLIDLRSRSHNKLTVPVEIADLTGELSKIRDRITDLSDQLQSRSVLQADLSVLEAEERLLMASASDQMTTNRDSLRILEADLLRNGREQRQTAALAVGISDASDSARSTAAAIRGLLIADLPDELQLVANQQIPLLTDKVGEIEALLATFDQSTSEALQSLSDTEIDLRSKAEPIRTSLEEMEQGLGSITARIRNTQAQLAKLDEISLTIKDLQIRYSDIHQNRAFSLDAFELEQENIFEARQEVARTVTDDLGENVVIVVEHLADSQRFRQLLNSLLQGSGLKYRPLTSTISQKVLPRQLLEMVESGEASALAQLLSVTLDRAERLIEFLLQDSEALEQIAECALEDSVDFMLKDGSQTKSVESLSTGQKCAVTLPILLTDHSRTLILDQPEDHLDNAYLVSNVVASLNRRSVLETQTIVATHNANIPVLGSATEVVSLESDGTSGSVTSAGPFDDTNSVLAITTLMEGGKEAFQLRATFYRTHGIDIQ